MDPEAASLYAFALGLEGTSSDDSWRLVAINFHSILSTPCELWEECATAAVAAQGEGGCLNKGSPKNTRSIAAGWSLL